MDSLKALMSMVGIKKVSTIGSMVVVANRGHIVLKASRVFVRYITVTESADLVKCPQCKKEVMTPYKSFKNSNFQLEAYTCSCGHCFKVSK
jgi:hypothetical protein